MCRLNCVGVEKSEYINVGVKKWLKKTAFRCKKVEAKKGYHNFQLHLRGEEEGTLHNICIKFICF